MIRKLVLAGGAGCLGAVLRRHFTDAGWEVIVLSRQDGPGRVGWDGHRGGPWEAALCGADAVVNLAGRSVDCRYTAHNRRLIMDSRILSTRILGAAIARCERPPKVWLNSSTATIYRHTTGPAWDESGEIGAHPEAKDAFSVEVAQAWEREFEQARTPATRKVALRTAMVLSRLGGVFPVLGRLVRAGLGGTMGGGDQFVSWIHETDFCRAVDWLIGQEDLSGPVNVSAPGPRKNAEFMDEFRRARSMPLGLPASRWMLELGAMVLRTETELILKSRRVVPGRLLTSGFRFRYPDLEAALSDLCQSQRPLP